MRKNDNFEYKTDTLTLMMIVIMGFVWFFGCASGRTYLGETNLWLAWSILSAGSLMGACVIILLFLEKQLNSPHRIEMRINNEIAQRKKKIENKRQLAKLMSSLEDIRFTHNPLSDDPYGNDNLVIQTTRRDM